MIFHKKNFCSENFPNKNLHLQMIKTHTYIYSEIFPNKNLHL